MIYTCAINTPLGVMTASAEEGAIRGLWFTGQQYYPQTGGWTDRPDYPPFAALRGWLDAYFAGKRPLPVQSGGELRLEPQGTAFQKEVWEILLTVPYGALSTYGGIAKQLAAVRGRPVTSARAVGGAVGRNPISILIPCHRIVGAAGDLTGYAGGLDKKKALLTLEGHGENPPAKV